jgi:aminoglycoside 3-N-acetyltransferase
MSNLVLFESSNGPITRTDFYEALCKSGAADAEVLYVHTALNFGQPSKSLSRSQLLGELVEAILELGVKTVCMPTFTFSFCNGLGFDVQRSKSQMGALNENFRKRFDAYRSEEPLMSVAAIGADLDLVTNLGVESTGSDSTFDKLSKRDGVKFLFLGVHPGDCFTYMHYLEWKAAVPYRYNREFTGEITNNGLVSTVTKKLFVRYNGVVPNSASYTYGDLLQEQGHLQRVHLGDSNLSCVPLQPAENLYLDLLASNPNYFITDPFNPEKVNDEFNVTNMVAL